MDRPPPTLTIRPAHAGDVPAIAALYAPFVRETAVTFDIEPPSVGHWAQRFARAVEAGHPWLVAADPADEVAGWVTTSRFRLKEAYDPSVECGVYIRADHQGTGVGLRLYTELFPLLVARGFHRATAAIALPNDASVALHVRAGFRHVGTMSEIGRKLGRWWDVAWYERPL